MPPTGEMPTDVSDEDGDAIQLLVVARHPFRIEDLGLDERAAEHVQLIRRVGQIETAIDDHGPSVALVDTGFPEKRGFEAIGQVLAIAPSVKVLALTPDPPPHADVALATRAGAAGFIDVDAEPAEFAAALRAVGRGETWFPQKEVRPILAAVAGDLETTATERRSRLTGILLGLIPLTGLIAALMAFIWRKYLGQIGVRPVDLAVDPASRVVDAIVSLGTVLGVFGPLLYVANWLDLLRGSPADRGPIAWLLQKPKTAHVVVSLIVLGVTGVLAIGPDVLLVVVIAPLVVISMTARSVDVNDELPAVLRIEKIRPMRVLAAAIAALILFLGALSVEGLLVGPNLGPEGAGGWIVPRVLGFKAQPMLAFDVSGETEPREVLYLGGNADLYVLVDPCDDDTVEFVSVGSHRLVVIDEITCPEP